MSWKCIACIFLFVILVSPAHALSLTDLSFGDVNQGMKYTQILNLVNAPNDIDNHFVIQVDGSMKDWITVSPSECDLKNGTSQALTVTLRVPYDARLGSTAASITAVASNAVSSVGGSSGSSVGYSEATKSKVTANVIKAGATADINITGVDVPTAVKPGDVVKFTLTAQNIGNIPATGQFYVNISENNVPVISIPAVPVDFAMNSQQIIKLYWDTQGRPEGPYTAVISVVPSSSGTGVKSVPESYPPITITIGQSTGETPSSSTGALPLTLILGLVGIIIVIIVIIAFVVGRRSRDPWS
jgi:uncharacterized repeat protein (TIGR01451 family)